MKIMGAIFIALVVAAILQYVGIDWVHYARVAVDALTGVLRDLIRVIRRWVE